MPVIMIHTLELREDQKRDIARKYTQILSQSTNVPEERIYVFFAGYPLEGIAAGGVLNSDVPAEALAQFETKLTGDRSITVLTRMKARPGMDEIACQETMQFLLQTRQEPGCLAYDLYRSETDLYRKEESHTYFVLQEHWRDGEAVNAHLAMPYFQAYMAQQELLFEGPFEVTKMIGRRNDAPEIDKAKLKVVLHVKARPNKLEEIKSGVLKMAEIMRAQPGCLRYDVYQGFEGIYDISVFMTDQLWSSPDARDAAGQHLMAHMPFYLEDLDEPRQPIVFRMVSTPAK